MEQNKDYKDLQTKYELTDEQIKSLKDSGLSYPEATKSAQLSKSSSKPLSETLAMRVDQKMGWGKIAKDLGVHPSELGQSVSALRHEKNENQREQRMNDKMERQMKAHARKDGDKHH